MNTTRVWNPRRCRVKGPLPDAAPSPAYWFCIQIGSSVSHLAISLIDFRGKSCLFITWVFWRERSVKVDLNLVLPGYEPVSLPIGQTRSLHFCERWPLRSRDCQCKKPSLWEIPYIQDRKSNKQTDQNTLPLTVQTSSMRSSSHLRSCLKELGVHNSLAVMR